ncbi:DUF6074 family protein [Mesorhizobium sp. CAU 1741]|uniref:DUF6074 family protein n=1 Tax=Mesorhizobium sp. CAU 1741 TaxID=3140366 RepID=UPI00325B497A
MNVIPFPIEAEVAAIERAAISMERREARSAAKWWQTECRRLYARYTACGIPDADSRAIVDRFARAVQRELERRAYLEQCQTPGDAA